MRWLLLLLIYLLKPAPIKDRLFLTLNGKRVKHMDITEGQPNAYKVIAKSASGKEKALPGKLSVTADNANASFTVDDPNVTFEAVTDGDSVISIASGDLKLDVPATVKTLPATTLELVPV